ncbi:MAG: acyl-CoA dehydrogenase family protein [Pseudomonadales bacterium]
MNFDLSDEQQLIADSVDRFVQDNYSLEARIALAKSKTGFSSDHWNAMAELGWMGLPFCEADGGFGGSAVDTMVIMEAFGKGLVLEPYFTSAVLAGSAFKHADNSALSAQWLPGIIDGSKRLTLAYAEEQAGFDLHDVQTSATATDGVYSVNGHKSMVGYAQDADALIVSVRLSGAHTDSTGIGLLVVPGDSEGLHYEHFPTVDGQRASEVTFKDVKVASDHLLVGGDHGFEVLSKVAIDAILALSAEALGCMEILYKDTVAYTQEREQFDHALSDFQVLQHRMVDMFMEYEQCKSLLYRATLEVDQGLEGAARTVHALKYMVGKTGTFIGENAVQLHGGMGMTEELRLGHYFKRLLVIDAQFGNADHHLHRFAA